MAGIAIWKVISGSGQFKLEEIKSATELPSLDAISRSLPTGSYTTFRTFYGKKVIRFKEHLARLHTTAKLIDRNNFNLNTAIIRAALLETINHSPFSEHRIRLILDLEKEPGIVYIILEKLVPLPLSEYQDGISTVTCDIHRSVPKAKLTRFIASASEIRGQLPADVHEALMTTDGKILEGLSSNFFAIKDGVVWTAEEGVLSGVTRSIVLDEIRLENIPLCLLSLPVSDIPMIQEAFITSSSRGILPVIRIDNQQIGDGSPGPVTHHIHQCYLQRIEDELEDI
jgi:branched-subunit amino acid aminotransferase/4-amino-4-deoxychorismate lyase